MGIPLPHFDWKIVPAEGVQPPAGQLLLGGPAVFRGYLADDGRLGGRDAEGYFPTGDVVSADTDGCLIHGGRLDGLVKVGGYLVNPMEVERLIMSLPGVNDAHCVAKPHDILGRCLEVDVLLAAGAHATAEEIRRACAERLEPFKVPRQVNVVRHIDLTAMGKAPRA